jgi:hypothetical protein
MPWRTGTDARARRRIKEARLNIGLHRRLEDLSALPVRTVVPIWPRTSTDADIPEAPNESEVAIRADLLKAPEAVIHRLRQTRHSVWRISYFQLKARDAGSHVIGIAALPISNDPDEVG